METTDSRDFVEYEETMHEWANITASYLRTVGGAAELSVVVRDTGAPRHALDAAFSLGILGIYGIGRSIGKWNVPKAERRRAVIYLTGDLRPGCGLPTREQRDKAAEWRRLRQEPPVETE